MITSAKKEQDHKISWPDCTTYRGHPKVLEFSSPMARTNTKRAATGVQSKKHWIPLALIALLGAVPATIVTLLMWMDNRQFFEEERFATRVGSVIDSRTDLAKKETIEELKEQYNSDRSAERIAGIEKGLARLEKNFDDFHSFVLDKISYLPPDRLQRNLPALVALIQRGTNRGIDFDKASIRRVIRGMREIGGNTPAYWQAASQVITYRSQFLSGLKAPDPPKRIIAANRRVSFIRGRFDNASVTLDGNEFGQCVFVNCLIIYQGGPVYIAQSLFQNCVFRIAIHETPGSDDGAKITRALLGQESTGDILVGD